MADEVKVYSGSTLLRSSNTMSGVVLATGVADQGDKMTVANGGTAYDTTVGKGGSIYLYNGAVASGVTAQQNATRVELQPGAVASNLTADATALSVEGTVYGLTVHSAVYASIKTGGVVSGGLMQGATSLSVNGGAISDFIVSQGTLSVTNGTGMTANRITLRGTGEFSITNASGCDLAISAGSATFNSGAYVSGVTMTGGRATLYGGTVEDFSMNTGVVAVSGGVASGVTLTKGTLRIYSGGTLRDADVYASGQYDGLSVYGGGVASGVTVRANGIMVLNNDAVASGTTVMSNGSMTIAATAVARDTVLSGGRTYLNGTASGVTVKTGVLYVSGGAVASDVTLNGGTVFVYDGATVRGGEVNFGGQNYNGMQLYAGAVASGVTVKTNGYLTVAKGASATGTTLAGGTINVSSGGTAGVTATAGVLNFSAGSILSGGVIGGTTTLTVGANVTVSGVTLNLNKATTFTNGSGGDLTLQQGSAVLKGGDYDGLTVTNGTLELKNGAVVSGLAFAAGNAYVSSTTSVRGGTMTGGRIYLSGTLENLTVDTGVIYVSGGAVASNVTLNHGTLNVYAGGILRGAETTASGGWDGLNVYGGAVASGVTVKTNGILSINAGAVASNTTLSGGRATLYGTADGVTVDGGVFTVSSGAVASDVTLNSGTVSVDGIIRGGAVNFGGGAYDGMRLYNGAVASGVAVNADGVLTVSAGATATDVTVNADGVLTVVAGASAEGTLAGGAATVTGIADVTAAAGTFSYAANALLLTDGSDGDVTVSAGSVTLDGGNYDALALQNGALTLQNGAEGSNLTVTAGTVTVADTATVSGAAMTGGNAVISGTANDVTMNGGAVNVAGTAGGVTVNAGTLTVEDGGTAAGAILAGGTINVSSGGIAGVTATAGTLTFSAGSILSGGVIGGTTTLNVNANMTVSSVGLNLSSGITFTNGSGGDLTVSKGSVTLKGGNYDGLTHLNGGLTLQNGVTGSNLTVAGGEVYVSDTASVSGATMTGGKIHHYGTIEDLTINTGVIYVYSGAVASDVILNHGTVNVYAGGILRGAETTAAGGWDGLSVNGEASGVIVKNNGSMSVAATGVASGTTVMAGGSMTVNGTARNTILDGGSATLKGTMDGVMISGKLFISSGAVASNVILNSGTVMVSGGATVRGGEVNFAGESYQGMIVSKGGVASGVTVNANGRISVNAGATIVSANLLGGRIIVGSGGTAGVTATSGVLTFSSGSILSGGVIGGTTTLSVGRNMVVSGVTLDLAGNTTFTYGSGGDLAVTKGSVTLNGGSYDGVTVGENGNLLMDYGVSVSNVRFEASTTSAGVKDSTITNAYIGRLVNFNARSGNKVTLKGTITIANRIWLAPSTITSTASVDADGATFVFDLANRNCAADETMLNQLNRLQGVTYEIQVGSDLAIGDYQLTSSAETFTGSMTVKSGTTELDTMTVGSYLVAGDLFYGLLQGEEVKEEVVTGYYLHFTVASAIVDLSVSDKTISWTEVDGASKYLVSYSENDGENWTTVETTNTSYEYTGSASDVQFKVQVSDGTNAGNASVLLSASADLNAVAANAKAGDKIQLASGTYTGTSAITVGAADVALVGQGKDSTTVSKAIYGAGNAVTVANLTASTNVAGGAVNADAAAADLTVSNATLTTDAFAGSLVKTGSATVTAATAAVSGTTFRNLYGAGYATGTGVSLNSTTVNLTVSGNSASGSIFGAGRAANGATLTVSDKVTVNVDNGSTYNLGALYAGGYANGGSTLTVKDVATTISSGHFSKFVAGGSQVYGSGTTGTATSTNLTVTGGTFGNAVLGASYAAGGANATVTGTATTTISGGTFQTFVAGGGYANGGTLTVGSVDLTISGGKFVRYVFGGNLGTAADGTSASVTGQVHLTLDASTDAKIEASAIYAGSLNGSVGSTLVELKGNGSNLEFDHLYGSKANPTEAVGVTGTKTLYFNGFSGELSGKLYQFDAFTMSGSTVKLAVGQGLTAVSTWDLNLKNTGVDADTALIDWTNGGANSFAGDTMNLTFNTTGTSYLVIDGTGTELDLALDKSGLSVNFNGYEASYADGAWSFGGWTLSNVTTENDETVNKLVLAKA